MPYQNVPDDLQDKMESCVMQVMDKGSDKEAAVAICYTSVVEGKSLDDAIKAWNDGVDDALKAGARNSAKDAERLQAIHDMSVENGAVCHDVPEVTETALMSIDDTVITTGDAIKADTTADGLKLGGYLVRFTSQADPDISNLRDYFTADTDFDTDFPGKASVYFDHGLNEAIKRRKLSTAILTRDEVGIWAETILTERDAYEKHIAELAKAGKLGWSSGTAAHLVDREAVGAAHQIKRWPLGLDASLTHRPAEPRNVVMPLKSLIDNQTPEAGAAAAEIETKTNQPTKEKIMEIDEVKLSEMLTAAASKAVEQYSALPVKTGGVNVAVTHDPADNPFKSIAEQCAAVKSATMSMGREIDPRLLRLEAKAATGANEGIPSQGGYLIDPTLTASLLQPIHETGPFTRLARRLPVGANSNFGWINGVDETSRADGSRWGGIRGYRLAEAGSKTASKPKFRRINWELKKYAVLVYATDELLADASQFSAIVQTGASEELSFMANDDIVNGDGAAGPFGIMSSGALISITKETGQAAATIVYNNVVKMWARLLARSKANAAWFISADAAPQINLLAHAVGTAAIPARFVNYGADGALTIMGKPVYETEFNATLGTTGDILLADMSEYLFWEKGGVEAASSIHVQFVYDESVFRFVYRCDGNTSMASAVTPNNGGATQSSFVVIETRS